MTIRHLRIFKRVCEEENITRAAGRLFMTQPAVSHVIQELEAEIGQKLFDRISRKIVLNEVGKLFLRKSVRVLELYDELEACTKDLQKKAVFRIGSSITIANFWLPKYMKKFEAEMEEVPVKVEIDSANKVIELLQNNEIDLALAEGIVRQEEFVRIPFSSYELCVICSPDHRFSKMQEITLEELLNEKLLLREKGSAIRDTFDSGLLLQNRLARPAWTSVNSQALIQAVKSNLGVSVMPDILIEKELHSKEVCCTNIKGMKLVNENSIVYHRDKFITESMKLFLQIVTAS